jgi:hypothetical protein
MANLHTFTLRKQSKALQQNSQTCAFVPPSLDNKDLIKKKHVSFQNKSIKKVTKAQKKINTITQYFQSTPNVKMNEASTGVVIEEVKSVVINEPNADVKTNEVEKLQDDEEEPPIICEIRNKKPFEDIWNVILADYGQDYDEEPVIICEIRNKKPFLDDFLDIIQNEYAQDEVLGEKTTKRYRDEEDKEVLGLLNKKTRTDYELSQSMKSCLNLNENRRL